MPTTGVLTLAAQMPSPFPRSTSAGCSPTGVNANWDPSTGPPSLSA